MKKQIIKYLAWTFGISYAMEICIWRLYKAGQGSSAQLSMVYAELLMTVLMFVPFFGVLLAGVKINGMGWKPKFKGNAKYLIISWFFPALLSAIGAALYFLVFPSHLDLYGGAITGSSAEILKQTMEKSGLSYVQYILIGSIVSITYAPFINMIPAVGEETGWRGFLYPALKDSLGYRKAMIIGGFIWGMWHWPLIGLIGYEYGYGYTGFPITGMLVFALFSIIFGILCEWVYERTGCIWYPALMHGAYNAAASIPIAMCVQPSTDYRLLGASSIGLLAGLPILIFAAFIYFKNVRLNNSKN